MKKEALLVGIVISFLLIPSVSALRHPPTIKVFKDNVTYPIVDNWTTIKFNATDSETLFENCATIRENGRLEINSPGFYTIGGAVYLDLAVANDRSDVTFLMRVRKNESNYLRDTQRELTENIFKSRHEESISFNGIEKFERGDNLYLEYWTNEPDLMFISDKKFSENVAASLLLSRLSTEMAPQKIETSTNYGGFSIILSALALILSLIILMSRKGGGI